MGLNIDKLIERISTYMSKLSIDSHNVIVTNSLHLDLLSKTLDEIKIKIVNKTKHFF